MKRIHICQVWVSIVNCNCFTENRSIDYSLTRAVIVSEKPLDIFAAVV